MVCAKRATDRDRRDPGIPPDQRRSKAPGPGRGSLRIPMKIPHLRWIIALLLFLATCINYADRLALSVVSRDLRKEFAMTEQDYSYVVTAFLIAYPIIDAGSAYLLDRLP